MSGRQSELTDCTPTTMTVTVCINRVDNIKNKKTNTPASGARDVDVSRACVFILMFVEVVVPVVVHRHLGSSKCK
jgi:hypothetical protein